MYPPEKPTWEPENHTLEKESHLHTKPNFLKFSANFPGCNILFQMPSLFMQQNLLLPWNLSGIWTLLNLTNIGNIHFFSHTPRAFVPMVPSWPMALKWRLMWWSWPLAIAHWMRRCRSRWAKQRSQKNITRFDDSFFGVGTGAGYTNLNTFCLLFPKGRTSKLSEAGWVFKFPQILRISTGFLGVLRPWGSWARKSRRSLVACGVWAPISGPMIQAHGRVSCATCGNPQDKKAFGCLGNLSKVWRRCYFLIVDWIDCEILWVWLVPTLLKHFLGSLGRLDTWNTKGFKHENLENPINAEGPKHDWTPASFRWSWGARWQFRTLPSPGRITAIHTT